MDTVYLIKALLDGFLIGWGTCYLVGCARAGLKTAASAPRNALVRDDDAAEAPAPPPPRAESVKRPFSESDNNRRGNGADDGDDYGFHANIVPKKQEAAK